MNLVDTEIDGDRVSSGGFSIPLPERSPLAGRKSSVILGIRPTDFEHGEAANGDVPRLRVRPDVVEDLGSKTHLIFTIDAPRVSAEAVRAATEAQNDDEVTLFAADRAIVTAILDARRPVRANVELELALDPAAFHFFDQGTGLVLGAGAS